MNTNRISEAKKWLESLPPVSRFLERPCEASLAVSHAISLEIGGPNDNLTRHLYDHQTGQKLAKGEVLAEVIEENGETGVLIRRQGGRPIGIRRPALFDLGSLGAGGFRLFPAQIARKLEREGIEPVLVRDWLVATTFSDLNARTEDYRGRMWELLNNDAFLYTRLVAEKRMVFQGLHDVVEHAANAQRAGWCKAAQEARLVHEAFLRFFGPAGRGNIPSHILPFVTGVLVDDLTQRPFYGCTARIAVIKELIAQLGTCALDPQSAKVLKKFPSSVEALLIFARKAGVENDRGGIERMVRILKDDVSAYTG